SNAKLCERSRWNSSGPNAQYTRFESVLQCRYRPASREIFLIGNSLVAVLTSIGLPVSGSGAIHALNRSTHATYFSSGLGAHCCALSLVRCTRRSPPVRLTLISAALVP